MNEDIDMFFKEESKIGKIGKQIDSEIEQVEKLSDEEQLKYYQNKV